MGTHQGSQNYKRDTRKSESKRGDPVSWVLASCGLNWPFQGQDELLLHHRHIQKTLPMSVWQHTHSCWRQVHVHGPLSWICGDVCHVPCHPFHEQVHHTVIPINPLHWVRIWSIICWKISCAKDRPQGSQTNLTLPHGVLKVVSSDDS